MLRIHTHPEIRCDECDAERAEVLEKCRAAIRAERAYQECLHRRVGSKYGAERRERELDVARALRDRAAKELGL